MQGPQARVPLREFGEAISVTQLLGGVGLELEVRLARKGGTGRLSVDGEDESDNLECLGYEQLIAQSGTRGTHLEDMAIKPVWGTDAGEWEAGEDRSGWNSSRGNSEASHSRWQREAMP